MGRGTWQAMFHRVTQSWTWLGWLSTRLDPEFSLLQYLWLSKHFQFFFFHPWNPRQLKLPFPNHQRHLKLQKMLQPWHLVVFSWLPSGLGGLVQSELKPVLLIIVLTALSLLCLNCLDFVFLDAVVFQLLIRVWFFATPWTVGCQAPLSMEFSRQEYCSELPFPSPGDLPNPGIEHTSPAWQADALPSEPGGKPTIERHFSV